MTVPLSASRSHRLARTGRGRSGRWVTTSLTSRQDRQRFLALGVTLVVASSAALTLAGVGPARAGSAPTTERVSVSSEEAQATGDAASDDPTISADGRYVAFTSFGSLDPADTDRHAAQVYLRDRQLGSTALVSVGSDGMIGSATSSAPSISADGNRIAFQSEAASFANEPPQPTVYPVGSSDMDVFVRDRAAGTTDLVSVGSEGGVGAIQPAISADGRYVAFVTDAALDPRDTGTRLDVYVRDVATGSTRWVSVTPDGAGADADTQEPSISADGRYVAFRSNTTTLVPGVTDYQVYRWDAASGEVAVVSVDGGGDPGAGESLAPSISADGNAVAFYSLASDLGTSDTNGKYDVYVRDVQAATTARVSVPIDGGETDGHSSRPVLSADAASVAFYSGASDLVSNDTNDAFFGGVFFRRLDVGSTQIIDVSSDGVQANFFASPSIAVNADGTKVAFASDATQLVLPDENRSTRDVYLRDLLPATSAPAPPTATIVSPADAAVLEVGQLASYDFSCADDVAVASCDGAVDGVAVASGDSVITSTPGTYVLRVTAVDGEGATTTAEAAYTVAASQAPTITITTPADGARYTAGDSVLADYLCSDGLGSGVVRCDGTAPVGEPVSTSAPGTYTLTVDAEDAAGNVSQLTSTYEVVAAGDTERPLVWINRPVQGAVYTSGATVTASYACDDQAGTGVAACVGPVPSGSPIDTSMGEHVFEVVGTDVAGNQTVVSVTYTVSDGSPSADTTLPYVLFRTPRHLATFGTGTSHTVDYECVDPGPSASGIASCSGSVAVGDPLDTSAAGVRTITVGVTDRAGNSRLQYVAYSVIDDRDNDGLSDDWETAGVDGDGDGIADLRLDQAPYNADPGHRDMFVEMDYMTCGSTCSPGDRPSHAPQPGVLEDVTASFAAAPLSNPDGTSGVRLHLLVDEAVPEVEDLRFFPTPAAGDDYDDIKGGPAGPCNGFFGTAAERADSNCAAVLKAKNLVYRYGLFAHDYAEAPGSSGIGEYPGNDFLVTVGGSADSWDKAVGLRAAESGTVMHELGHTLALGHGGPRNDDNCKPNYLSVMSYSLQAPYYDPTRPLDYSRAALPTLQESALDESVGVQGPAGRNTVYGVNGVTKLGSASGPLDWNGDGDTTDVVAGNPNDVGSCLTSGDGETLTGGDDWANLQYSFVASPDFASGSRFTSEELVTEEITAQEATAAADETDFDADGVSNLDDVCPAVSDPGQADLDGDGSGDACDNENSVRLRVIPETGPGVRLRHRYVQVAVLSSAALSPDMLVVSSLRFGATGTESRAVNCTRRDVDGDKRSDRVCQYALAGAGFREGTVSGVLRGRLVNGLTVIGRESFSISR